MKGFRLLALAVILCLLSSPAFATRYELDDGRYFILSLGGSFVYVRDTAGRIQVWGDNQFGQLGKGNLKNTFELGVLPADFKTRNQDIDLTQLHDIVSGSNYSFFWMEDGTLYAVGNSDYGSLGKAEGYYSTHTLFTVPEKIVDLSCGFGHCLALTEQGEVYAWGRNNKGQVGDGSRKKAVVPVKLPLQNIVQIVAGGQFSLALDADGTLWGWGDNQHKTVSPGKEEYFASPVRMDVGSIAISAIEGGGSHVVLLDQQGQVWTWGKNDVYQLGVETKGKTLSQPTQVSLPLPAVKLAVYSAQNYAILSDSSLWSWGNNGCGQLGQGLRGVSGALPGKCVDSDVIVAETGSMFALCVLRDGTMLCSGFNNHAELGDGTTYLHYVMTPNGKDLIPD